MFSSRTMIVISGWISPVRFRLLLLAATLQALLAPAPVTGAEPALPIFDTHLHYSREASDVVSPREVIALLSRNGVLRALVSSTPDDGSLTLHRLDPKRFVPILRPYRGTIGSGNWHLDPKTPGYLAGRLAERRGEGIYRGIGEFHLFDPEDAKTAVLRRVAKMAVERDIFLHVHAGANPVAVLFGLQPELKILWAHTGMVTPVSEIRRMMKRYPKLWAELSFRGEEIMAKGGLNPAWRALLLAYPERFMIGTDTYANHRWEEYGALIQMHRRWLALLPGDAAGKIAFRNAARLFGWGRLPRP